MEKKELFIVLCAEELIEIIDKEDASYTEESTLDRFPIVLLMTEDYAKGLGEILIKSPVGVGNTVSKATSYQLRSKADERQKKGV